MIDVLVELPAQTAIFVDYDGSLAPIVDRPDDAVALPAAVEALRGLVARFGRVGVVSGRTIDFLADRLDVPASWSPVSTGWRRSSTASGGSTPASSPTGRPSPRLPKKRRPGSRVCSSNARRA